MKIDFKKIKSKEWYVQGGAAKPAYCDGPFLAAIKLWPDETIITYQKDDFNWGYFDKNNQYILAKKHIEKQKKDKNYIDNLIRSWEKIIIKEKKVLNKLNKINLDGLSDRKLFSLYHELNKIRYKAWYISINIELFDPWGEFVIENEIASSNAKLSKEQVDVLIAPIKLSYIREERKDLIRIAKKFYNSRNNIIKINIKNILKKNKAVYDELRKHKDKFHYYMNDWANIHILDEMHFLGKLKRLLKMPLEKLNLEEEKIATYSKDVEEQKKEICLKKKLPDELANVFYLFERMSEWRDIRKKYVQIVNYYLNKMLKEISKRTDVELLLLEYITYEEINSLKFSDKYIEELKTRKNTPCVLMQYKNKKIWVYGKDAEDIHNALNESFSHNKTEIKGKSASHGLAVGIVRIIPTIKEFSKMNKGDILVAPMTRPEYMPIMEKAAAIVTVEGGLTCHAAIVSRELGKPCIVGAQGALMLLKDGMKVEVNAYKGIVKILK